MNQEENNKIIHVKIHENLTIYIHDLLQQIYVYHYIIIYQLCNDKTIRISQH